MSRLIDADALRKRIKAKNASNAMMRAMKAECLAEIDDASTIEPERKKGRWMWSSDEYGESWICSECMAEYSDFEGFKDEAKYCPNCGSAMEGAKRE